MPELEGLLEEFRREYRRSTGKEDRVMVLGNGNGVVDVPGYNGTYVYARPLLAGGFGRAIIVRMKNPIKKLNGATIWVGYDSTDNFPVITGVNFDMLEIQGVNPALMNPNDDTAHGYVDMRKVGIFQSHIMAGSTFTVALRAFVYLADGRFGVFTGQDAGIDLTSYIPATANYHCYAMLLLKPDNTYEVKTSTSQPEEDRLDNTDLDEALAQASVGSIPAVAWRLAESASALTNDDHVDLRQWINTLTIAGWQPYAYPLVFDASAALTTALTLASNGGSIAVPMKVDAPMQLESVSIQNTDTATERTWGWDLYRQVANTGSSTQNTLYRVAACSANDTFTPSAASTRTLTAGSTPVYLSTGIYWLAIQCRHATNNFGLGSTAVSAAFAPNSAQTKTTTNPNGSTLDFVAATWTKVTAIYGARLNGRVFGQTSAF
jgi:hypothetical protein